MGAFIPNTLARYEYNLSKEADDQISGDDLPSISIAGYSSVANAAVLVDNSNSDSSIFIRFDLNDPIEILPYSSNTISVPSGASVMYFYRLSYGVRFYVSFQFGSLKSEYSNPSNVTAVVLANLGSAKEAGRGAKRTVVDLGHGVDVESDGYSFRGAERRFNGLSVSPNGELLLNGRYCRELGLNAYSLITDIIDGTFPNKYKDTLNQCADMGVRIVRVNLTCYTGSQQLAQIHGGVTPKKSFSWSDLSVTYRNAVKSVFDYAATLGIYLVPSIIWQGRMLYGGASSLYPSETGSIAFGNAGSKTRIYARNFAREFARNYKDHKALGAYSCGNEFYGNKDITFTELRAFLADIGRVLKSIDPSRAVFSSNYGFEYNGLISRPTFDACVSDMILNNPDPIDTVDYHLYSTTAYSTSNPTTVNNSLTQDASPYWKEMVARFVSESKKVNKPFVLTEFGVSGRPSLSDGTGQELFGRTEKLEKMLEELYQSGVQLALMWNIGSSDSISSQVPWNIAKGTARGDAYQPLFQKYVNKFRLGNPLSGGYDYFKSSAKTLGKPITQASFANTQNCNIQYPTSNPQLFGESEGTVLFWLSVPAINSGYARVLDASSIDLSRGFSIAMSPDGLEPYLALNGVSFTTSGSTPPLALNSPSMRGFSWSSTCDVDCIVDGFNFITKSMPNSVYTPRQSGDPLFIGSARTGFNPFNGWLSGVLLCKRRMTPEEISDYYNYGVYPADALVVPMDFDASTSGSAILQPNSVHASISFGLTSFA